MLIAIEGCDRTGKTVLAGMLAEETGGEVRHAGPPTDHPLVSYESSLASYDPRDGKHVILDRFHLGEHVWPQVFNRESQLGVAVARHIELFLRSRGLWLVYAERDEERLRADIAGADPPEPIGPGDVFHVLGLFRKALLFTSRMYSVWDYERNADTLTEIVAFARAAQLHVTPVWELTSEWIGNARPSVLLVGDEFGPPRSESEAAVPFNPWRATSGHYLMRALPEEWWHSCAVVNAHRGRKGDWNDVVAIWSAMGRPPVVALGRVADDWLKLAEVPHAAVPHPQWWRRFKHHDIDEYTDQLREAACFARTAATS